jgi:hypothetical protein
MEKKAKKITNGSQIDRPNTHTPHILCHSALSGMQMRAARVTLAVETAKIEGSLHGTRLASTRNV